jgi:hypothetical protein
MRTCAGSNNPAASSFPTAQVEKRALLAALDGLASVTAAGGRTGWFPPEMDDGHLDYYFVLVVVVTVVNFAVFVALAKNYTHKRVR